MFILCTFLLSTSASVFSRSVLDENGPLKLTPLIENGDAEKARTLSKVDPKLFAGVESYSAYITVNKTFGSHLYFWFFPAKNQPLEKTPWLIWLQGGPGVSSLYGLFNEIGPLQYVNGTVQEMLVTWGSNYSLLFIDNPVGAGFSFSEKERYVTNEDEVGSCLLIFLQQFLTVFPELRQAPLFITGESYAGKYIPAFGHYIHNNRNESQPINLKGLAVGNGFTDPPSLLHYSKFGLQTGLLDPAQAEKVEYLENAAREAYEEGDIRLYSALSNFILYTFLKQSALPNVYNYLDDESPSKEYAQFLNNNEVKNALHVGPTNFIEMNSDVYNALRHEMYLSVKPWLEELLDSDYNIMYYSGQLDVIVAYALSVNTYHSLNWTGADEYIKAPRKLCGTKKQVYIKEYGNFVDAMIRGAGHMAPHDQPQASKDLIDYFINKSLDNQEQTSNDVWICSNPVRMQDAMFDALTNYFQPNH